MDYSGHIPDESEYAPPHIVDLSDYKDSVTLTPIQRLVNQMIDQTVEAREKILNDLIQSPGIVATFGNDFDVEFLPVEIRTADSGEYSTLDEYRVEISQKWRIVRKDEDGHRATLG